MSGKATVGTDYTLSGTPGQAVIGAGQATTNVIMQALVDNVTEKQGEAATMTLTAGSGYAVPSGKNAKFATTTVTITDN
jgi:hypothetical protein